MLAVDGDAYEAVAAADDAEEVARILHRIIKIGGVRRRPIKQGAEGALLQGVERQEDGGDHPLAGKVGSFRRDLEVGPAEVAGGDEGAP